MSENINEIKEPLIPENTPEPEINIDDIIKPEIESESCKGWIKEFTLDKARDILKSGQTAVLIHVGDNLNSQKVLARQQTGSSNLFPV
eukprot:gene7874-9982_t